MLNKITPIFQSSWIALVVAMISLTTGCTSKESPQPNVVHITARDYSFDAPDTVAAGWTTFLLTNGGEQPHMGQLLRLEQGVGVDSFLTAYNEAFRTAGARPEFAPRLGGPTVATPGQTTNATMYLTPGNYVWICLFNLPDGIPHVTGHGMARGFVVKAIDETSQSIGAPKADVDMTLVDYAFGMNGAIKAGRRTIRVLNQGSESHEVGVLKLAPGKTLDDVRAWMQNPVTPMEDLVSVAGGTTSFAPGNEVYFDTDFTPGDYVLICLVTAPDGRSHMEHGMIQPIHVQ